ncbi:hypothetical protein [Phocaeicola sp.]|uniref:hypothetical protein n=1 Tax=Phocaeicola sp. TaxID=2773926 RepID=UPI003AB3CEF3
MDNTVFDQIDRLYHYTTVESLVLILKNRTLRLNPLDKMDDLQEAQSLSRQNYGQFVYVSSWTDMKEESIPMWKMYSSMTSGVRISLPPCPFQIFDLSQNCFRDPTLQERASMYTTTALYPVVNIYDDLQRNVSTATNIGQQLHKVEYTDDVEKLCPKLEKIDGDKAYIALDMMGIYKSSIWSFQSEYRYLIRSIPCNLLGGNAMQNWSIVVNTMIQMGGVESNRQYIDLRLAGNMLDQMVITTSPAISPSNKIIVEALLSQFCPKARIESSALEGKVR